VSRGTASEFTTLLEFVSTGEGASVRGRTPPVAGPTSTPNGSATLFGQEVPSSSALLDAARIFVEGRNVQRPAAQQSSVQSDQPAPRGDLPPPDGAASGNLAEDAAPYADEPETDRDVRRATDRSDADRADELAPDVVEAGADDARAPDKQLRADHGALEHTRGPDPTT
jgi:hypothetical protein